MITYVDSSVVVRMYLADEPGHRQLNEALRDPAMLAVTGTWTKIEVTGAIVRATRSGRADRDALLASLDNDLGREGFLTEVNGEAGAVEPLALDIARAHGLRALDAWHLAVAATSLPQLDEGAEGYGFASRDAAQAAVAEELGFQVV